MLKCSYRGNNLHVKGPDTRRRVVRAEDVFLYDDRLNHEGNKVAGLCTCKLTCF